MFHFYKLSIVQQLMSADYCRCLEFAVNMLSLYEVNEDMLLFISDETHFHLNGFVNKGYCCYYLSGNPQNLHERPLHNPKITVWCAVSKKWIIGPDFWGTRKHWLSVTWTCLITSWNQSCADLGEISIRWMFGFNNIGFLNT